MPHSQFLLKKGFSRELEMFPQIIEFGRKKNNTIHLDSFTPVTSSELIIYYVVEGKFEWCINKKHYVLYPGDTALIIPGDEIGGSKCYFDIGTIIWLKLGVVDATQGSNLLLGEWSKLSETEKFTISKILMNNNLPVIKVKNIANAYLELRREIKDQEIGFVSRVNQLIDSLIITICRESTRQSDSGRDFPKTFLRLEEELRKNLSHQWTVDEMAALMGLGTTAFTEKVKAYSGFSPLQYLINLRVTEAIKLLKRKDFNITEIALETGFYSSQHFSTTFKKLTGHSPGEFRKSSLQVLNNN